MGKSRLLVERAKFVSHVILSEFQTVGPATGKARGRSYVLSRPRGTIAGVG